MYPPPPPRSLACEDKTPLLTNIWPCQKPWRKECMALPVRFFCLTTTILLLSTTAVPHTCCISGGCTGAASMGGGWWTGGICMVGTGIMGAGLCGGGWCWGGIASWCCVMGGGAPEVRTRPPPVGPPPLPPIRISLIRATATETGISQMNAIKSIVSISGPTEAKYWMVQLQIHNWKWQISAYCFKKTFWWIFQIYDDNNSPHKPIKYNSTNLRVTGMEIDFKEKVWNLGLQGHTPPPPKKKKILRSESMQTEAIFMEINSTFSSTPPPSETTSVTTRWKTPHSDFKGPITTTSTT